MRFKAFICALVAFCFAALGAVTAVTQDQVEDVRGAFLTTRPKPAAKTAKSNVTSRPSRRRPKPQPTKPPGTSDSGTTSGTPAPDTRPKITPQKLGVGLTLLTRDSMGLAVRVDPTRTFLKGDRIRVLLETNADGYLYIFNTTNGGKPLMIYPNKEIDEGGNYIQSHVPFEIPSSTAADERLRWLVFDEVAGSERLYFVFTREPLPGIPIEDELIAFCSDAKNTCPMQPSAELWTQLEKDLGEPLQSDASKKFGNAQTPPEREAIERGIGLSKDEPEPSLIMMSASAKAAKLVTVLDLVHK